MNRPETLIIGDKDVEFQTRRKIIFEEQALLSLIEQNTFAEASKDDDRIKAMN